MSWIIKADEELKAPWPIRPGYPDLTWNEKDAEDLKKDMESTDRFVEESIRKQKEQQAAKAQEEEEKKKMFEGGEAARAQEVANREAINKARKESGTWWKGMPETNYNHPATRLTNSLKALEDRHNGKGTPISEEEYQELRAFIVKNLEHVREIGSV